MADSVPKMLYLLCFLNRHLLSTRANIQRARSGVAFRNPCLFSKDSDRYPRMAINTVRIHNTFIYIQFGFRGTLNFNQNIIRFLQSKNILFVLSLLQKTNFNYLIIKQKIINCYTNNGYLMKLRIH